jgi:acyl carrier protein
MRGNAMTETKQDVINRIKTHLPFGADPNCDVREDSVLSDLGVDSLHLITLMLTLQEEFDFDPEGAGRSGLPTTIGDLVALVEGGRQEGPMNSN